MDFVVGLPKTMGKYDSIWVIVDRLTKSAHFIPVKVTYNVEKLAKSISQKSFDCMEFHSPSYQIEVRSLLIILENIAC